MKQMIIIIAILAIFVSCKDSTEKVEMDSKHLLVLLSS